MKNPLLVKLAVGAAAVALFGFLFMRSLEDTRSEAYNVDRAHLQPWALALEQAARPNDPILVLRAPPALAGGLFRQIFARAMESLNSPADPSIPLVLRGEFDAVVGEQLTQDGLLEAAKAAGIAAAAPIPRCIVHRRISEPGGVRQAYFAFFDAPAIAQFRRQLGLDREALSPVMPIAGAGTDFNSWYPLRVNSDADCLAPIEIAP